MQSSLSRRSLFNYIGIGILIAGMATGEFIYWRSLHSAPSGDDPLLWQTNSKEYQREVQTYVGTFGLVTSEWSQSLAKLREPKPLAITITVVSALAAGGCFLAASRMPRD